jgi:hypothetical protein
MMFMNEWEIDEASRRHQNHPVLGPATRTLSDLRDAVNRYSDGWAYWPKPSRAARLLQELIKGTDPLDREREDATPALLRKAYGPLRAFRTREGIEFVITEVSEAGKRSSATECDECEQLIPDSEPNMINIYHAKSCSLHPASVED